MRHAARTPRQRVARAGLKWSALVVVALGLPVTLVGAQALRAAGGAEAPIGIREPPRSRAGVSLDHAIESTERRYRARVVRASTAENEGRRIYVLRLLSEEGRVWTVRIDAQTGSTL